MGILQGPPSAWGSFAPNEIDRLGDPLIRLDLRASKVVEPAQHVVVPTWRERKEEPLRIHDRTCRQPAEQATIEQVLLALVAGRRHVGRRALGAFVLE